MIVRIQMILEYSHIGNYGNYKSKRHFNDVVMNHYQGYFINYLLRVDPDKRIL